MVTSKISTSQPRTRRGSGTLHFLAQEELKRLWAVIQDARDTVLFLLAYRRDLHASEIGLLQRTDVDLQPGEDHGPPPQGVPLGRLPPAARRD